MVVEVIHGIFVAQQRLDIVDGDETEATFHRTWTGSDTYQEEDSDGKTTVVEQIGESWLSLSSNGRTPYVLYKSKKNGRDYLYLHEPSDETVYGADCDSTGKPIHEAIWAGSAWEFNHPETGTSRWSYDDDGQLIRVVNEASRPATVEDYERLGGGVILVSGSLRGMEGYIPHQERREYSPSGKLEVIRRSVQMAETVIQLGYDTN